MQPPVAGLTAGFGDEETSVARGGVQLVAGRLGESLDAGADPVIVAGWISRVQGERIHAERELVAAQPSGKLTAEQVRALMDGLTHLASVLAGADPKLKAKLYDELGITVRYDRSTRIVAAQSRPQVACATVSVGGPIDPLSTPALFKGKVHLRAAA